MLVKVIVAFIATFCFSVLFKAPTRLLFFCGLIGTIAYFINLLLRHFGVDPILSTFLASIILTTFARFFSYWKNTPSTVFLIPGIFPLVPGTGIYYTINFIFATEYILAITKAVETLLIAGAIVVGILVGIALPKKLFFLVTK